MIQVWISWDLYKMTSLKRLVSFDLFYWKLRDIRLMCNALLRRSIPSKFTSWSVIYARWSRRPRIWARRINATYRGRSEINPVTDQQDVSTFCVGRISTSLIRSSRPTSSISKSCVATPNPASTTWSTQPRTVLSISTTTNWVTGDCWTAIRNSTHPGGWITYSISRSTNWPRAKRSGSESRSASRWVKWKLYPYRTWLRTRGSTWSSLSIWTRSRMRWISWNITHKIAWKRSTRPSSWWSVLPTIFLPVTLRLCSELAVIDVVFFL